MSMLLRVSPKARTGQQTHDAELHLEPVKPSIHIHHVKSETCLSINGWTDRSCGYVKVAYGCVGWYQYTASTATDIIQFPQLPIDWGTRNARHQRLLARETHKKGSRPTALAPHESAWPWLPSQSMSVDEGIGRASGTNSGMLQSHNQKFSSSTRHYSHFSELYLVTLAQACFCEKKTDLGQLPQKVQMTSNDYDSTTIPKPKPTIRLESVQPITPARPHRNLFALAFRLPWLLFIPST